MSVGMNQKHVFVLVEGISDVAFLSLYLKKIYGFDYVAGSHRRKGVFSLDEYKRRVPYKGKLGSSEAEKEYDQYVRIVSCGGHTSFGEAFNQFIKRHFDNAPSGSRLCLIILEDADENGSLSNSCYPDLRYCNEDVFLSETRGWNKEENGFAMVYEYKATKCLIPYKGKGCLETVLLDAIRESEPDLVNESERFIDNLPQKAAVHILKRRKRIKAKSGVVFTLINPEGTFNELVEKFDLIDCKNEAIAKQFRVFGFLANQ